MTQFPEHTFKAAMESLQGLGDEELKSIIDNDEAFSTFACTVPQILELEQARDASMAKNKELAEHNMGLEPKLKEGKANLWELYEKARSLQDEVESKRVQLESLNSRTSLDTTHALLQASSAEAEEKSEELAESFLGGETELESFLSTFPHKRMSAHLLRLKTDKMAEIVNSSRNMGSSNYGGAAPYPVSPAMMPMPQYQM